LHKNDFEAMRFISSQEKEVLNNFDEIMAEMFESKPDFEEFSEQTLNDLHNGLVGHDGAKEYFKSRGIDMSSMKYFALGYSEKQDMVTVPVHSPDGICIGIVGRSIQGKSFKNSTNLPKSKTIFSILFKSF
jgi:hypothetical protein